MLRFLDILLSLSGLLLLWPLLMLLLILGWFDTGSPVFFQQRVGRNQKPFILVKLRTMHRNTASVATHLASESSVTRLGSVLRKTKLDELPQLWNVIKGDMSLVGPRPCLFNQTELILARQNLGVYDARPGITGLAQVRGIDMSTPQLLAETDATLLATLNLKNYFRFLAMTLLGKGAGDRINFR